VIFLFSNIQDRYRDISRFREIAEILIKHGFGFLIEQLDLEQYIPLKKRIFRRDRPEKDSIPLPNRARMVLEDLGPTFVKFGQLLSTRPDLVPKRFINEFEKLQDDVSPLDFEEIKNVLKDELGEDWEKKFDNFKRKPLAAASIGQVHEAHTEDGRVVVKIQRPDIETKIRADLNIMFNLAQLIEEKTSWGSLYNPVDLVEEFQRVILDELDYRKEARNTELFRSNFKDSSRVKVPCVYWDLTRRKVLTIEKIEGVKLSQIDNEDLPFNIDRAELASIGAQVFMEQIMIHGFFHGDPHPGNIIIVGEHEIAFIDFGVVGRLEIDTKKELAGIFIAFASKNIDYILEKLIEMDIFSGFDDRRALKDDLYLLLEKYYHRTIKDINIGEIFNELISIAYRHNIKIPRDYVVLGKALITIEGTGKELDPEFNVFDEARPFAKKLVARQMNMKVFLSENWKDIRAFFRAVHRLPVVFYDLINQFQEGRLQLIEIDLGLDKLVSRLDVVTNRLSMSMIISAIIIASSMVMLTDRGPTLGGLPAVGVLGYILAFIFGIFLIISILRSGRF